MIGDGSRAEGRNEAMLSVLAKLEWIKPLDFRVAKGGRFLGYLQDGGHGMNRILWR